MYAEYSRRWFAWRPVILDSGEIAWLTHVYRRTRVSRIFGITDRYYRL